MADGSKEIEAVPTALYRHFDADGNLLYVGISLSPTYRLAQHRDASCWFYRIASVKVEWLPSRPEAMTAERNAVRSENPEFNIVHRIRDDARAAYLEEMAEDSCAELTRKVTRYDATYTVAKASIAIGIGTGDLRLAMLHGELAYFPNGKQVMVTGWAVIAYLEALQAGAVKVRKRARNPDGSYPAFPSGEWLADNHGLERRALLDAWAQFLLGFPP